MIFGSHFAFKLLRTLAHHLRTTCAPLAHHLRTCAHPACQSFSCFVMPTNEHKRKSPKKTIEEKKSLDETKAWNGKNKTKITHEPTNKNPSQQPKLAMILCKQRNRHVGSIAGCDAVRKDRLKANTGVVRKWCASGAQVVRSGAQH